jgi:5-methylcytosine-specific restriction enzyme subunit McrC
LNWDLFEGDVNLLPIMKLDTMIESNFETIILDTKYYKEYYSINEYGGKKIRSEHLYQIMSYMNNVKTKNKLRGILLYPMPYNGDEINEKYLAHVASENEIVSANIEIITVDLSKDWKDIKSQLISII